MIHTPVLLQEIIEALNLRKGKCAVDGTINGGGHAGKIIEKIMPSGTFIGIDLDKEILEKTKKELTDEFSGYKNNLFFEHANYKDAARLINDKKYPEPDAFLLDLGFSSFHIEKSGRGFSFQKDEPLDMRYDRSSGTLAGEIVNGFKEEELADIIWKYGEERFSRRIAEAIVRERKNGKILTTGRLAEIIGLAVPGFYRRGRINPSTRTFQALRIFVNGELESLAEFLETVPRMIAKGGRLAIISFHSLEDRIVKNAFAGMKKSGLAKIITKKPLTALAEEISANPRSRSAKLRVLEII